jgi:hypothetical protein
MLSVVCVSVVFVVVHILEEYEYGIMGRTTKSQRGNAARLSSKVEKRAVIQRAYMRAFLRMHLLMCTGNFNNIIILI